MPGLLPFLGGLFLGMILVPAALRWGVLVHTSVTKQEGDFLGRPRRRLLWFTPFAFLLHPIPYVIAGLLAASLFALLGRLSTGALWILAGFYTYAVFIGVLVIPRTLALRRKRRDARNV